MIKNASEQKKVLVLLPINIILRNISE